MPTTRTKPLKPLHKGMGLYQVFHWPDKAPDKSKTWAVANLETGDVNGRWHATKEEALAQARAMYARLGDKAKVHSEEGVRSSFFFRFADPASFAGEGVKWIEAIAPKSYHTPTYGEVVITPDKIERFISNVNGGIRGQDIAINYEHGLDPVKGKKAAGWIRGARKNGRGNLEVAVDFTEPAKQEVLNKEWKYFSLEWDEEWMHPDGVIYRDVVMGGALTNRPVAKGLMPINFSEIFTEVADSDYEFAVWSTAYVNNLPDSSFAYIESGGSKDSEGKTTPRSLRHFPYKDENGKIDLAHVRNMIARAPQADVPDAVKSRVQALGRRLLGAKNMSELMEIDTEFVDEQKEWEHSEPGTGSPPAPRQDEDGSDDPDRTGGWRRDTPPIAEPKDIFTMSEDECLDYLKSGASSLQSYIDDPTTENNSQAASLLNNITVIFDNDTKKYSEYTDLCVKVKKFFSEELAKAGSSDAVVMQFTEAEAIGYLTSAKAGLNRIHTNAADAVIDKIDAMLAKDFRTRSFNELQQLVSETRTMLRSGIDNPSGPDNVIKNDNPLKGGNTVGELTEKDLRELRNVLDVDDDGKILEAVKVKFGELSALRDAVSASEQERVFAEQYPQFYAQHQQLMERDRKNTARSFAESIQTLRKAEGLGLKSTKNGLSTKALELVTEAHMKFSEGRGTVEDLEELLKNIMNGGIVQFGEIGSSADDNIPEIDTGSATGIAASRRVFAEVVSKIQRDNPDLGYLEAVAEASKKHPDLAESYKITLPA